MSDSLSIQKERLLSRISHDMYYGLINYMRKIYNGEYDAVILMARRFSNLYTAMLPLVQAEYFGTIQEEHKRLQIQQKSPLVISDRAVDFILVDIAKKGNATKYKRILLADDIIIHGTTLKKISQLLETAYKVNGVRGYRIEVIAYAQNEAGSIPIKNLICKEKIEKCNANTWKKTSSNFLDILYIMGQSYTSYVPSARISMDTEAGKAICTFLEKKQYEDITDPNMKRNNVNAYAFSNDKDSDEIENSFQLFETYRIYQFNDRRELLFVPMVNLKPIDDQLLDEYYNILERYVTGRETDKLYSILDSKVSSGEYKYRLVVYILSALKGLDFWQKKLQLELKDIRYEVQEESMNFACTFLQDITNSLVVSDCSETYEKLQETYENSKARIADLKFSDTADSVGKMFSEAEQLGKDVSVKEGASSKLSSEWIGKLLQTNSRLDEEEFERSTDRVRLVGVPLVYITKKMMELGDTLGTVVNNLLFAIDYGKGSIIPHKFIYNGKTVYASVLRAGEQNYRYLIDRYMPVMYGMYLVDKCRNDDLKDDAKQALWSKYEELQTERFLFWEKDKEYLLKHDMEAEFENILVDEALEKMEDPILDTMISTAEELIGTF